MSRPIKFQAYDTTLNVMITWEEIIELDDLGHKPFVNMLSEPDIYKVRQFTGLKDRNGQEIYEGDIIRVIEIGFAEEKDDIYNFDEWAKEVISYVVDHDGYVTYEYSVLNDVVVLDRFPRYWLKNESFGYGGEDLIDPGNCEVIGNIYEHPHLLKGEGAE